MATGHKDFQTYARDIDIDDFESDFNGWTVNSLYLLRTTTYASSGTRGLGIEEAVEGVTSIALKVLDFTNIDRILYDYKVIQATSGIGTFTVKIGGTTFLTVDQNSALETKTDIEIDTTSIEGVQVFELKWAGSGINASPIVVVDKIRYYGRDVYLIKKVPTTPETLMISNTMAANTTETSDVSYTGKYSSFSIYVRSTQSGNFDIEISFDNSTFYDYSTNTAITANTLSSTAISNIIPFTRVSVNNGATSATVSVWIAGTPI